MRHLFGRLTPEEIVRRSELKTMSQKTAMHGINVLIGIVLGISIILAMVWKLL